MSAATLELVKLEVTTVAEDFVDIGQTSPRLPYQRIVELYLGDGGFGDGVTLPHRSSGEVSEQELLVTPGFAKNLLDAAKAIREGLPGNCHRFSRRMANALEESSWHLNADPITETFDHLPVVDSLPEGAVGVIGVEGYGVPHSMVGFKRGVRSSVQVMSSRGDELGIVPNEATLDYYRQVFAGREVQLYEALSASLSQPQTV